MVSVDNMGIFRHFWKYGCAHKYKCIRLEHCWNKISWCCRQTKRYMQKVLRTDSHNKAFGRQPSAVEEEHINIYSVIQCLELQRYLYSKSNLLQLPYNYNYQELCERNWLLIWRISCGHPSKDFIQSLNFLSFEVNGDRWWIIMTLTKQEHSLEATNKLWSRLKM